MCILEVLQDGPAAFPSVVASIGEYMSHADEKILDRAISFLSAVIRALPPSFLTRQHIQVVCEFLAANVENAGALEGLAKLQTMDRFTNQMAQTVVRA